EYGHLRAMKYFGMKTKGIYLIPFVGGLALSENKINTRWQEVVIAIMGPFFGLLLSLASLVIYWFTGIEMFAGLAVYNALLNLFNLLPFFAIRWGSYYEEYYLLHALCGGLGIMYSWGGIRCTNELLLWPRLACSYACDR
ncbi:MAG: site-2 protease family protein, partial [Marinomonas sp.]